MHGTVLTSYTTCDYLASKDLKVIAYMLHKNLQLQSLECLISPQSSRPGLVKVSQFEITGPSPFFLSKFFMSGDQLFHLRYVYT